MAARASAPRLEKFIHVVLDEEVVQTPAWPPSALAPAAFRLGPILAR